MAGIQGPWHNGQPDISIERWSRRLESFADAAVRLGETDAVTRKEPVVVGPGATEAQLADTERSLGMSIPPVFRLILSVAARFEGSWQMPDSVEPPPSLSEVKWGLCTWTLEALVGLYASYRSWVDEVFPDPRDPYDQVWHDKFPIMQIVNGDMLAIDSAGAVVYLSHEDGAGHGYTLGRDPADFLDRWTALGCAGPEDWVWLPFTSSRSSLLEPEGKAALAWREFLKIDDPV